MTGSVKELTKMLFTRQNENERKIITEGDAYVSVIFFDLDYI